MTASQNQLNRIARQELQSLRLLGIDFIPRREVELETIAPLLQPPSQASARAAALEELRLRHELACTICRDMPQITQRVFGEGDPETSLMFIGEAPGEEEDRTGRPFVGRAGKKLDDIIRAMGLTRESVYICNVLKARPPANRTPLPDEVQGCGPFLREQIRIIHPRVIVALGGPAAKFLLQTEVGITKLRGRWGTYSDEDLAIPLMPTFHPAYLLRNYTRETREQVWSDMQAVLKKLAEADGNSPREPR